MSDVSNKLEIDALMARMDNLEKTVHNLKTEMEKKSFWQTYVVDTFSKSSSSKNEPPVVVTCSDPTIK